MTGYGLVMTGVALILGFAAWQLGHRRMRDNAHRDAVAAVGSEAVLRTQLDASYLGLSSKGLGQSCGRGCLVVSEGHVMFAQWEPRLRLRIPRERVHGAEVLHEHPRIAGRQPLLCVRFEDDDGEDDRVTWRVDAPEDWASLLG